MSGLAATPREYISQALGDSVTPRAATVNRTTTKRPKLSLQTKSLAPTQPWPQARDFDDKATIDITPTALNTYHNTWSLTQVTSPLSRCTQPALEPRTPVHYLLWPSSRRSILKDPPMPQRQRKIITSPDVQEPTRRCPWPKHKRVSFKITVEEVAELPTTVAVETDECCKSEDDHISAVALNNRDGSLHDCCLPWPSLKRKRSCEQRKGVARRSRRCSHHTRTG